MFDKLLPLAKQYQKQLQDSSVYVIAATARNMCQAEIDHVKNVLGWPQHMISRKNGDMQSGATLKIAGLKQILNLKQFANIKTRFFYEDNAEYLQKVSKACKLTPVYVPSKQGY